MATEVQVTEKQKKLAKNPIPMEKASDTVELVVTKEGAALKHNSWKEGEKIKVGKTLAQKFVKAGFCKQSKE